jgi:hypothetical protein
MVRMMQEDEVLGWKSDLERLEFAMQQLRDTEVPELPAPGEQLRLNPTLNLLELSWTNLCALLHDKTTTIIPQQGKELVLLFKRPVDGAIEVAPATATQLLALKLLTENLDREEVAKEAGVVVGRVDAAIETACEQGLLLSPPSSLVRTNAHFPDAGSDGWQRHLQSEYFTLQWHVPKPVISIVNTATTDPLFHP